MDPLEEQFEALRRARYFAEGRIERRSDGSALITIPNVPLPDGWNVRTTDVCFVVPVGYPVARPDTFWADPDLRLGTTAMPANTALNANYGGPAPRLWFSFHPSHWNPSVDTLLTFAKLVQARLREVR